MESLSASAYRTLDNFLLEDLESVRLILRGSSVIDWQRLAFADLDAARGFLAVHEFPFADAANRARAEAVQQAAIGYLRRNFNFPIPKPVENAELDQLLVLASGRGHRQLCACTILKVMHIIHHLEARELLYLLPVSDQEIFALVEQKVSRVVGKMLHDGLPIIEFKGGRKNKDSLYSKLLSKKETHAAQVYDKLRFRIVTREVDDVFPMLAHLSRALFAFNYVVPGQSTNTLFPLRRYYAQQASLTRLAPQLQPDLGDVEEGRVDNVFSSTDYRVVHFVVDMPVRIPDEMIDVAPPAAWGLGRVIFAQAEFQVIDRATEQNNEMGEASHHAYKHRQRDAIMLRLKVGAAAIGSKPPEPAAPVKAVRAKASVPKAKHKRKKRHR